ncbi:MAG TPA: 2-phospho-L-lactate guanylyltransferase [Gaiellaceae bacterium]|nr:2-phospho-L-lactate guanylyltransferase [Gaiellaceae bacterium]
MVVIPFAGASGKTRLHSSSRVRRALSLAMLRDVLAACVAVGRTHVVTPDAEGADAARASGAEAVADPGGGQGAAVRAALDGLEPGAILVVNADVPCVAPQDLRALLAATPPGGLALVAALDGTTNALSLHRPDAFAPVYGSGSAGRFQARAAGLGLDAVSVDVPNLSEDVDTFDDLLRLRLRCGPRTQACLAELEDDLA